MEAGMAGGGVTDPVPWMPGDTLFEQAALSALLHWDPIKFAMNERIRDESDEIVVWMAGVIREFIDKKKGGTEPTDLGLYILDIMDAEFTMTADEVEAVFLVKQLLQFYQDCGTGNTAELIEYMRKTTETRLFAELYGSGGPAAGADSALADSVAAMELGAVGADAEMAEEEQEPVVDPDGWETVAPKKKRGGRS